MYAFSYYCIYIAFESKLNYTPHDAAMQRDTARILVIVIMKTTSAEYESRTTTSYKALPDTEQVTCVYVRHYISVCHSLSSGHPVPYASA
jgi:hypothetical protein